MGKYRMVDKGLYSDPKSFFIESSQARAEIEGNFGCWCYYDENLFCQEREGCGNCLARKKVNL